MRGMVAMLKRCVSVISRKLEMRVPQATLTILVAGMLAFATPSTIADPCDPLPLKRCQTGQPPSIGESCAPGGCEWVIGAEEIYSRKVCAGHSPLCESTSQGPCNAEVEIITRCDKYTCKKNTGNGYLPCNGVPSRYFLRSTTTVYTGVNCIGQTCPGLVPGTPVQRLIM